MTFVRWRVRFWRRSCSPKRTTRFCVTSKRVRYAAAIALPVEHIADGHVFVAHRDAVTIGFAAVLPRADRDAELDALFVEPSLWKRGVGRLLVEHCADVARRRGARILHVVGNPHAERFYVACGFNATGAVETLFGAGLAMQRALSSEAAGEQPPRRSQ